MNQTRTISHGIETPSIRRPDAVLPRPTGTYPVGRMSVDFVDRNRHDIYAPNPSAPRELGLWIWYPAVSGVSGDLAEHMPHAWSPIADYLGVDTDGTHTHAIVDAPVSEAEDDFAVLIFSPSGFSPLLLAAIAEELASKGYVVVGVNHTYESAVTVFSDGRVVPENPAALGGVLGAQSGTHDGAFRRRTDVCEYKAADLRSVADFLGRLEPNSIGLSADRLDLTRIGAFGHSFGGNAALEWCATDRRCRAAANLDGAIWTEVGSVGLPRPALQILADHPEFALPSDAAVAAGISPNAAWYEAEKAIVHDGWRTVRELANPGITAQIAGATHMSFMDIPFLPLRPGSLVAGPRAETTIDAQRMWRITCDLLLAFFAEHVQGVESPSLDAVATMYPEVTIVVGR